VRSRNGDGPAALAGAAGRRELSGWLGGSTRELVMQHPLRSGGRAIAAVAAVLAAAPAAGTPISLSLSGVADDGTPFAATVRYSVSSDDVRVCRYFTCITEVPANAATVTLGSRTFAVDGRLGPVTATWSELGSYVELATYEAPFFRLRLDGPEVPYGVMPRFDRWFLQAGGIRGIGGHVGVPEPGTAALFVAAVAGLMATRRRQRARASTKRPGKPGPEQ
jgi:hypothetical protein